MPYYSVCKFCGAHLDPGEKCDCKDFDISGKTISQSCQLYQVDRERLLRVIHLKAEKANEV